MQISVQHHYEAKVDEVVSVMTDEAELRAKYRALDQGDLASYQRSDDGDTLRITQVRTVDFPVPARAAKLLVPHPVIRQTERWSSEEPDGTRRGTIELTCAGLPVTGRSQVTIEPEGDGCCVRTMVIDFSCDVPVIGGRIVAAVVAGAEQLIEADHRANLRVLARTSH